MKDDEKNVVSPEAESNREPQDEQRSAGENAAPLHSDQSQPDAGESTDAQDNVNTAEFAQNLTPGEEKLFSESEQTAADIASDLEIDSEDNPETVAVAEDKPEAAAEAEEKPRKKPKLDTSSGFLYYLRVAGTLTAICACLAVMLAFVNYITSQKIADNNRKIAEAAIGDLFADFDSSEMINKEFLPPVISVTEVKRGSATIGYCVITSTKGFGGDISLAVGVKPDGTAAGVKVLSMSETPGLGTRTGEDSFLSQFKGKTSDISLGSNISAVAGATISSKAVFAGVKAALELVTVLPAPAETAQTVDETAGATPETDGTAGATPETDGTTAETDGTAGATPETDGTAGATAETDATAGATSNETQAEQTQADRKSVV